MSKTETVKNLSNSPRAREQSQAMQTTKDLQNHVGELAELLTSATYRLTDTTSSAAEQIEQAKTQSQKAARHQHQLQKNTLALQQRQIAVTKRQEKASSRQQQQIDQLLQNQSRQEQRVPWLILGGAAIGALIASVTTFAGIWLMM